MKLEEIESIQQLFIDLESFMDIGYLTFQKMNRLIIDFTRKILLSEQQRQKNNLSAEDIATFMNLTSTGKGYLDHHISNSELESIKILTWNLYDERKDGFEKNLLRFIVCCLYDEDFEKYDPYMSMELLYSLLMDLGNGYCTLFNEFLKTYEE